MTGANVEKPQLFTVGHSDHDLQSFLTLLVRHGITAVADVRSQPYSRVQPQFNRESLTESLGRIGAKYIFLGRELGARRSEPESYDGNRARYDLIRSLPLFQEGLARLRNGVDSSRMALLCAEKDPLTCHRTILICRELRSDPIDICHILADGSLEGTAEAERRLLHLCGFWAADLLSDPSEQIERAYDKQAERIAYTSDKRGRETERQSLEPPSLHYRIR